MGITYESLVAYINGLHADGTMTDADFNQTILYILANGNLANSPRDLIQMRRGNVANLPALAQGEPAFCLDTEDFYVGGTGGNVKITKTSKLANVLTVEKTGGDFNTINAAIDYAKTYCTAINRVAILIGAGVWEEMITLIPNPGIDLIGRGKGSTIIQYNTAWPDAPLHIIGKCIIAGMTVKALGSSHALHQDSQDNAATGETLYLNCYFTAKTNAGVGLGLGANVSLRFENCQIDSESGAAIYAHNLPTAAVGQFLRVFNCDLVTYGAGQKVVVLDNAFRKAGATGTSEMYVSFGNTRARIPSFEYRYDNVTTKYAIAKTGDEIMLLDDSTGCNMRGLDYDKSKVQFSGYFPVQTNQAITIPCANADKYTWTCDAAHTVAGADVIGDVTMNAGQRDYVYVSCSNATVLSDKAINMSVTGVPNS